MSSFLLFLQQRMSFSDFGEKNLSLVQSFTAYSLCSWKFCFKVLSQCSLLCRSSRWGKRCVKFRIPVNLHMPLLLKTYLLLGSRVLASTDELFCSWKRGNISVAMKSIWKTFTTPLLWKSMSKSWIQNRGRAERAFPKEQAHQVQSVRVLTV